MSITKARPHDCGEGLGGESVTEAGPRVRMGIGALGTVLVMFIKIPELFEYGLDQNRTDLSPLIGTIVFILFIVSMGVLNAMYMYFRKETEILHLIVSSLFLPLLLICLLHG